MIHTQRRAKQLALRETGWSPLPNSALETDTAPGSSGSQVFTTRGRSWPSILGGDPQDANGRYSPSRSLWTSAMGEQRLDWKANEGVRISRVVRALREMPMTGTAEKLRAQLSEVGPPTAVERAGQLGASTAAGITLGASGTRGETTVWTLPLR